MVWEYNTLMKLIPNQNVKEGKNQSESCRARYYKLRRATGRQERVDVGEVERYQDKIKAIVSLDSQMLKNVKLQLYDIACRVHRGKGPERRFAAYWEALRQFLRFQIHQGPNSISSSLDGVHDVLNSFLVTKQMRKLHNLLVMGKFHPRQRSSVFMPLLNKTIHVTLHQRATFTMLKGLSRGERPSRGGSRGMAHESTKH